MWNCMENQRNACKMSMVMKWECVGLFSHLTDAGKVMVVFLWTA